MAASTTRRPAGGSPGASRRPSGAARGPGTASRRGTPAPTRGLAQPLVVTGAVAVILGVVYLFAPLMGQDLSAQIAHADFARDHPLTPVDFRWFGGTLPFGYSLFVPFLAAHVGPQVLGVIAAVAGTLLTTTIFVRTGVKRPVVGGIVAAVCEVANLTEGRIAFAVGLVFGLLAVLPLTSRDGGHRIGTLVAAFLAGAANPVAGLCVGVVALTLLLHARVGDALRLGLAAAAGMAAVSVLFADGGPFLYAPGDAARAAAVTVLVGVLVPRRWSLLWTGAAVGVAVVAAAYFLTTPVGANASRLAMLFALPVLAAAVELVWWQATVAVVVAAVVQPPVVFGTLDGAGESVTKATYSTPLTDQIAARGPLTGRVEIPETVGHWESAYVARDVPLARGWLRQVDIALNDDVFYAHEPTAASYQAFLQRTATQYVAVPSARLTFYGRREATLIGHGLPYLQPVWHNSDWTLYAVAGAAPVVAAPATDARLGAAAITFSAPPNTQVAVDARWFRWLQLQSPDSAACIAPSTGADPQTVVVRTVSGGSYTLTSSLTGDRRHCDG